MAKKKTPAEETAERLTTPVPRTLPIPATDFLSTGCTLMNLAFTGHPDRGVPKSNYLYIVGSSGSSKTWLTFCLFAEAARNKNFSEYRFIHDNAENGALMDVFRYFGQGVVDRLEPPAGTTDDPEYSETVQQFYLNLENCCRQGPCIYALDSMDALNDDADEEKFEAEFTKHTTGAGKIPGSMGMAKAKTNSKNINRVVKTLRKNGSILVIISQTRDKVGGMFPGQQTHGGGRALKFYAHLEPWCSVIGPIKKTYQGKDREIGATIRVDLQKNRVCGWEGKFEFDFIKQFGVDDVGSNVSYLVDENHWSENKGVVQAPEFQFSGKREALIKKIQDAGDEWELSRIVGKVWNGIIEGAAPERKKRYV